MSQSSKSSHLSHSSHSCFLFLIGTESAVLQESPFKITFGQTWFFYCLIKPENWNQIFLLWLYFYYCPVPVNTSDLDYFLSNYDNSDNSKATLRRLFHSRHWAMTILKGHSYNWHKGNGTTFQTNLLFRWGARKHARGGGVCFSPLFSVFAVCSTFFF